MDIKRTNLCAQVCIALFFSSSVAQAAVHTVDFSTDDNSSVLVNGQAIDVEFFTHFTITSRKDGAGSGHLGPTIFDSTPTGPNMGGGDPDLLVGLGNVLMLQNNAFPTQAVPGIFDTPDDEANKADRGTIIFNFVDPVELRAIDLVDVNGGVKFTLRLFDTGGLTRTYSAGEKWTYDVTVAGLGYGTLSLTTLLPQSGEGTGGDATALQAVGFNPAAVTKLEVSIGGNSPSGAIDNLEFRKENGGSEENEPVPEPLSLFVWAGLLGLVSLRRKCRAC